MGRLKSAGRPFGWALLALLLASPAAAQTGVVINGPAEVRMWRNAKEIAFSVPTGTVVQIIEKTADLCWVVLPPDANGTRRVGWIRNEQLRVSGTPPPEVVPGEGAMVAASATASAPPLLPPVRGPRRITGFVQGIGGFTLAGRSAGILGGAAGLDLTRDLQITFETGRVWNVAPDSLQVAARRVASNTEQVILVVSGRTTSIGFDARLPADYGIGGVRYRVPVAWRARPYISGHFGLARVQSDVSFTLDGTDITSSVVGITNVDVAERAAMWGGGGGVTATVAAHLVIEGGYRFLRIESSEAINTNRIYAGVGVAF